MVGGRIGVTIIAVSVINSISPRVTQNLTVTGHEACCDVFRGGGGYFLVISYWECAAEWGRIFTTRLTIMGSPFQAFSIELLEWGCPFLGL